MTAGNDVVDLSKWNGTGSVNIGDIFSSDNDKVTVMAKNLAAGADLKLTSIENLEIVNSGTTASVALNSTNFKGLEAIKLIGDGTTLNVSGLTQGVKIDATPNADSIIGSDKADTINGGAGNDTIVGNDGVDILTGGNGADTFVVGPVKAAGIDQILDFSAEDKIALKGFVPNELKKFDASTFSTVTYKTLDSVLATFGPNGANETKAGDIAIFTYDGKTYALLAKGAFSVLNDALIDITGTNVASLTESNFGEVVSQYIYANYAEFKTAATTPNTIPNGEAIIKTMTTAEAGTLLGQDAGYLALVSEGGIKKITGKDPIAVTVTVDGGIGEFDAKIFDSKLGADVVDVTLNINGSANSDIIYASKLGGTITAGSGVDRITLNEGVDTVVFESTPGANGVDTITKFTAGAGGDVLAISGLLGSAFDASKFITASGSGDLTNTGLNAQVLIHTGNSAIIEGANSSSFGTDTGTKYKLGNGQKLFVVDTVDNANILYLATESSGSVTVTKVGTLNAGNDITSLTAANFVDVA